MRRRQRWNVQRTTLKEELAEEAVAAPAAMRLQPTTRAADTKSLKKFKVDLCFCCGRRKPVGGRTAGIPTEEDAQTNLRFR
jgi:hypothetical protein